MWTPSIVLGLLIAVPQGEQSLTFEQALKIAANERAEIAAVKHKQRAVQQSARLASKFPDPMVGFGYFVTPVETRVGPQEWKLSVTQKVPWPSALLGPARSAGYRSEAAGEAVRTARFAVESEVAAAYWRLWQTKEELHYKEEQLQLLGRLVESVRARLETGKARFSAVTQLELALSKLEDNTETTRELMVFHGRHLLQAIGRADASANPSVTGRPSLRLPEESTEALRSLVSGAPGVVAAKKLAESKRQDARAIGGKRLPALALGADYISTGQSPMGGPESGKDPVVVRVGLNLPLWQSAFAGAQRGAEEQALFHEKDAEARAAQLLSALEKRLVALRSSVRSTKLRERVIVPQAEALIGSLTGALESGRVDVAALVLAEKDLLQAKIEAAAARANAAMHWYGLRALVGRDLESVSAEDKI